MKNLRTLLSALAFLLVPALHAQDVLLQPTAITSSTSGTDLFNVVHLIDGSGLSGSPTLDALGTHPTNDSNTRWVTAQNGTNYFNAGPTPELICTLPQQARVSELVIWGYGGNANEAKAFEVAFSNDGTNFAYPDFVTQPTLLGTGAARLVFPGGAREATHVRLRVTQNHFFTLPTAPGGDRVGLGEIRFVGQPSQVIVRNLGNTPIGDDFLNDIHKVAAHAFTTGPAPLVLSSITLRVRNAGGGTPRVRVNLCADTGTAPGTVLADLGIFTVTNTSAGNVTWNPAAGTAPTLAPGTRYWVTAQNEEVITSCYWTVSANGVFTGPGTLTTARAVSTNGGANWADATNGNIHLLQVTGVSPFVVTNVNNSGPGSLRQAMAKALIDEIGLESVCSPKICH